jgi:hypothetical protein
LRLNARKLEESGASIGEAAGHINKHAIDPRVAGAKPSRSKPVEALTVRRVSGRQCNPGESNKGDPAMALPWYS